MKRLSFIQRNNERHWVGDGFPVRSIFSYNDLAQEMSPFLLLDYAGPENFPPSRADGSGQNSRRGVGSHPHRGFETVTIVYDGEVEHRDSAGGGGRIGPGDVQWMTAASGLVHDEFHGADFAKNGGRFEMIQLWVNLPKKDKMAAPGYQSLGSAQIPRVELPNEAGSLRVIAGEFDQARGPARTFSPVNLWDVRLTAGRKSELKVRDGFTTGIFVLSGRVRLAGGEEIGEAELAVLEREGETFTLEAMADTTLMVLNGQPLNEPVVGYGPFVMNTQAEIRQAFADFQSGRMGQIA
jgi:redox-sensitive bicupin YhaK (pirin superfamily)